MHTHNESVLTCLALVKSKTTGEGSLATLQVALAADRAKMLLDAWEARHGIESFPPKLRDALDGLESALDNWRAVTQ